MQAKNVLRMSKVAENYVQYYEVSRQLNVTYNLCV